MEGGTPQSTPPPEEDDNGNAVHVKPRFNVFGDGEEQAGNDGDEDCISDDSYEPSGVSEVGAQMTPRQKAVAGIRRRKTTGSVRKRLRGMSSKLCGIMMCCMAAGVAMADEVVGEPLREVCAVFKSRHEGPSYDQDRVDFLEVFSGKGNISAAFAKAEKGVLRPRDLLHGDDLRQRNCQEELFADIDRYKPRLVWLAPPCTRWCAWSRLNYDKQARRRQRDKDRELLKVVDEVFLRQRLHGGHVIMENPKTSDMWDTPRVKKWWDDDNTYVFDVEMCAYGMKTLDGSGTLRKGMRFLCTHPKFVEVLGKKCPGGHEHVRVEGKQTAHSGTYPVDFARKVVRALGEVESQGRQEVLVAGTRPVRAEDGGDDREHGADQITFNGSVPGRTQAALRRLHQNLGHPSGRELERHLRMCGANEELLRGARCLKCAACEKNSRPRSHQIAKPASMLDFNEAVAIDILFFDTCDKKGHMGLNMVDLASGYQVVEPLPSRHAPVVYQTFMRAWVNWAGVPERLVLDLDTSFQDAFWELTSDQNIAMRAAAGQAHWQNGIAERYGGTWKEVWSKLCDAENLTTEDLAEGVAAVNHARNTLRNRSGYSPRQWVFGCNPREVPNGEDGPTGDWSALSAITADAKIALHPEQREGGVLRDPDGRRGQESPTPSEPSDT